MSKPDTRRPGSKNRTQSKKPQSISSKKGDEMKYRLSEEKALSRPSKNRGKSYRDKRISISDRAEELDLIQENKQGLWVPKSEPTELFSPDDLVRMRLTWICATLVGVFSLTGVVGIVVLLIYQVDTEPLLQFVERVTKDAFFALAFALGYYFRGKHLRRRR